MSDHHDDERAREHDRPLSGPALRAKALESLLVEKGLVDPKALDELIDTYETKVGPRNGARIVARAWVDPAYRSEEHTSELQSHSDLVCRLLLEKKKERQS